MSKAGIHKRGSPAEIGRQRHQGLRVIERQAARLGVKPFVEGLPEALQADFLTEYENRVDAAYGVRADGRRLLAFPRLFIVAQRKP